MSKAIATAVAESPINRWKNMAKVIDRPTNEEARERARSIEESLGRIDLAVERMLPTEHNAREQILARKKDLEKERAGLKLIASLKKIPQLSLEPLTWRDKNGWPQLIILGLDRPVFEFKMEANRGYGCDLKTTPNLPEPILHCYEDVIGKLFVSASIKGKSLILSSEFTGVFPAEIRAIIEVSKSQFEKIFIVAEAQKWTLTESEPIALRYDPCPLVVGWQAGQLWLIDYFDLTPLENYIKSEFAV